jgi:hypothetical protein
MATTPIGAFIEHHYTTVQKPVDHPWLRCSKIGEPCERSLFFDLRWTTPLTYHEGRVERLFQSGHLSESRMVSDLRSIGLTVFDHDEDTGKQFTVSFLGGHLQGSTDGVVLGVPETETAAYGMALLLECKTHNQKSFDEWLRFGVAKSKPLHMAQMQSYMMGLELSKALYLATNKNNDQVEAEIVDYDPAHAQALVDKAERIITANSPPERNESFACRWCRHDPICHKGAWPRANCRTCLSFSFEPDGTWSCDLHKKSLTVEEQRVGCKSHLFVPSLVPGAQVDSSVDHRYVAYELDDGAYVDGADPKRYAPEVA